MPLIDLIALSIAQLNALGPARAAAYDRPDTAKRDLTHLSEAGSDATAVLLARELIRVAPGPGAYLLPLRAAAYLTRVTQIAPLPGVKRRQNPPSKPIS